jgi:hypothetical protein
MGRRLRRRRWPWPDELWRTPGDLAVLGRRVEVAEPSEVADEGI